ncbi:MAG: carotenoid biosynthesis protein [Actinomycetota bacterium]|nr:carotenoid biosynthesis protein [Actinomycetota bacterium]
MQLDRRPAWCAAAAAAAAGLAAQIAYPLSAGSLRDLLTVAVVLLFAGACAAHAVAGRGTRWAAAMVTVTAGGGLLAEFVGTATGFPFGGYVYTADGGLGPEVAGVPLLIGPAWTFGAYPAWCAARALVGSSVAVVPVAAWGLASWDLYLDPQMVADGRWSWEDATPALPGLPGIPLSNYAGWLVVALLMTAVLHALDRASGTPRDGLPLALFCWTWLGTALAHAAFLDLPVSAAYGLVGMGVVGVPLLHKLALAPGVQRPWQIRQVPLRGRVPGPPARLRS